MSLTGRPSRPPFLLVCSSQIFMPSRADLPLAARPPVIAMLKPILISCALAATAPAKINAVAASAKATTRPDNRHGMRPNISSSLKFGIVDWAGFFPIPCRSSSLAEHLFAPNLVGELDDLAHLGPLLVLGEDIAFLGRGEAALRRQAELLERSELRRFLDALLDVALVLERAALGGYQAEHDLLVTLGQEAQRLEAAGALGVVFQEIAVVIDLSEQGFCHGLIAAFGNPGRAEIAAADMRGDDHVRRLRGERGVDHLGVSLLQTGRIVAAIF